MVQWTEKPAVKPQASAPKPEEPRVAPRPVRKARKGRLAGPLQALTVCAVFGALVASFFMYQGSTQSKHPAAAQRQAVPDRDVTTGRIVIMDQAECRELGFDNQSGRTVQKGNVSCSDAPAYNGSATPSLYRHPTNRLESIRKSFAQ